MKQPHWYAQVCEAMLPQYGGGWAPCHFKRRHTVTLQVGTGLIQTYYREVCNLHFRRHRDGKVVVFIIPVGR